MLHDVILLTSLLGVSVADYQCLCNYRVDLTVYDQPDSQGSTLGHLYEFDCKPTYGQGSDIQHWQAIQYEKQLAYTHVDEQVKVQTCPGHPATEDLIVSTTVPTPTTTFKLSTATTSVSSTSTATTRKTTIESSTGIKTSQQHTTSTSTATMTPKPTTPSTIPMTSPTATMPSSTALTTTTQRKPTAHVPHGDISKCPAHVRKDAIRSHGYLNQYDQYCFVLNPQADTWTNAEKHCTARGGHLLTIRNAQEQEFFTNYLKSHHYIESIYIGLNDNSVEGNYSWTSGAPVTYTNWVPGFYSYHHSHASDDCVVMRSDGKWDDISCGVGLIGGVGAFEKHHFICQYGFDATLPSILGLIGNIIGK